MSTLTFDTWSPFYSDLGDIVGAFTPDGILLYWFEIFKYKVVIMQNGPFQNNIYYFIGI